MRFPASFVSIKNSSLLTMRGYFDTVKHAKRKVSTLYKGKLYSNHMIVKVSFG